MKYSTPKLIKLIDEAVKSKNPIDHNIDDTDQFIDILDHYKTTLDIKWPSHIIRLDEINASILVNEIKTVISKRYTTDNIIEYIENRISDETSPIDIDSDAKLANNNQLIDILEYFEQKYKLKIPTTLLEDPSIEKIANELFALRHFYVDFEFIIIYAKMFENKQTKEVTLEGPFFGEQADSKEEIDKKAKELVERQQGSALLVKVHERRGRTDNEIMKVSKKYYQKLYAELKEHR